MASTATKSRKPRRTAASREKAAAARHQKVSDLMTSLELWEAQADPEAVEAAQDRLSALKYSDRNIMLIIMQHPSATDVACLGDWNARGRYLRPGSKGIGILAPIGTRKAKDDTPATPSDTPAPAAKDSETGDAKARPAYFKVVYVWDISQTLPEDEWKTLMEQRKAAKEAALAGEAIADGGGRCGGRRDG